jgi:hypothetical protein
MASEPGSNCDPHAEAESIANERKKMREAGIADAPLPGQGSGGPEVDRRENSTSSAEHDDSVNEPQSTPFTDMHQGAAPGGPSGR